tara:strand:- start:2696 stop:2974 length:279 start_codon:yes stop_codon:yes gene_type:complete
MIEFLTSNSGMLMGGGATGAVLFLLKKIPNDDICYFVEQLFYGIGKGMTLGLSKWSFTKNFWNKTIEPWFIDLIDNLVGGAVRGLIKGLRID